MNKYNIKTIIDYIDGVDIEAYDIDELENNPEFMMDVIRYTNDKRIYNLCSDEVKNNYEFVKFMINKFKYDYDFICLNADKYLEIVSDEYERAELVIMMINLTKNTDYCYQYALISDAIYYKKEVEIEILKEKYKNDSEIINKIQSGFWFIIDEFGTSDIIMNFYAKRYIDDLFTDKINLSKVIHEDFNTYEELDRRGINNYLINIINNYDCYLSLYASNHLEVLDNVKTRIKKIKNNWDLYINEEESILYNNLLDAVHKYLEEHVFECLFDVWEIICYIGAELGISDKIDKYIISDIKYLMNDDCHLDIREMSDDELKHYYNIKKLMIDILSNREVDYDYNESKIIDLKLKKRS